MRAATHRVFEAIDITVALLNDGHWLEAPMDCESERVSAQGVPTVNSWGYCEPCAVSQMVPGRRANDFYRVPSRVPCGFQGDLPRDASGTAFLTGALSGMGSLRPHRVSPSLLSLAQGSTVVTRCRSWCGVIL